MAETVDELTVAYEEDGYEIVRELGKEVLSKGAWATVAYVYQDWDGRKEEYSKPKITIRRYRKMKGSYRQQSKFNVSSMKQARHLATMFTQWADEHEE